MAVFKINKTTNYIVMSNHHLRNKELSLKAKGLLSIMLSLPQEWDYSIAGLCSIVKENESAVKSALAELKQFGYLVVTKKYANETNSGRIEYQYDVYEEPLLKGEIQPLENLRVEIPPEENPGQLNKDNKILNNKIKSIVEEDKLPAATVNTKDTSKTITEDILPPIGYYSNEDITEQKYKELKDLTVEELERLKQIVIENRDSKLIKYREIKKMFDLVDKVTYDTPTECNKLISRKRKGSIRLNKPQERCTGFGEEIF